MKLSQSALAQFKATMILIQQHEISLKALRNHAGSIIKEETGVDVSKGEWELNQETGELTAREAEVVDERAL